MKRGSIRGGKNSEGLGTVGIGYLGKYLKFCIGLGFGDFTLGN